MAAQIRNYVPPFLYRYRRISRIGEGPLAIIQREISSIQENYLWTGSFDRLNDPMEGQFRSGRGREWREILRDRKAEVGICSFSETPHNELMWAHYADEHQGFCVEYDFEALRRSLVVGHFTRVHYSDEVMRVPLFADPIESAQTLLKMKSNRWLYEREWRYLREGVGRTDYHPPHGATVVTRIFLGFRVLAEVRDALEDAFPNTPISPMEIRGYRITFPE